jgi:recombination protein U
MDEGKQFEEDFAKSVPDHVFSLRLHDSGGLAKKKGNRFTQKNLCDYVFYDGTDLYLMEMKSHKGSSIPSSKLTQLDGLLKQRKAGVVACFALNYRDHDKTYIMTADQVAEVLSYRKSVPLSYCDEHGVQIPQEKKITRWRYDLSLYFGHRGGLIAMEKTREHIAWEKFMRMLAYLNSFGGNKSEMEKTTRLAKQAWEDAGIPEPDEVGEDIGFGDMP